MKFFADFHTHSHYSLATSSKLIPEYLDYWSRIKGLKVIGTGDFTHPGWIKELKKKLEPAEPGLFSLKRSFRNDWEAGNSSLASASADARFILTAELSHIYKRGNRVRKIHQLILAPGFDEVDKIQKSLLRLGMNLSSDGRPILGMDTRDLLELCLNISPDILLIPAHVWTPWFSVLGSKSGFDSIQDCYRDLTPFISAIETGLSSDPPMNWMCSFLDRYTIISNSDAHSPEKLGREANIFSTGLSYYEIINAIKNPEPATFLGTVEFYPQLGKYHHDGHRKCSLHWSPSETAENRGTCPRCGKRVTVGVMNRVLELADRPSSTEGENRFPFFHLIGLKEILAEILGIGIKTRKVTGLYHEVLEKTAPELNLLVDYPLEDIRMAGFPDLARGIGKVRAGDVKLKPGFDGEYGSMKIF